MRLPQVVLDELLVVVDLGAADLALVVHVGGGVLGLEVGEQDEVDALDVAGEPDLAAGGEGADEAGVGVPQVPGRFIHQLLLSVLLRLQRLLTLSSLLLWCVTLMRVPFNQLGNTLDKQRSMLTCCNVL